MLRQLSASIMTLAFVAGFAVPGMAQVSQETRQAPLTAEEKGMLWCSALARAKAQSQPTIQAALPFSRIQGRVDDRIFQVFAKRGYTRDETADIMTEWEVGIDPATPLETACRDVDPTLWR